MSDFYESIEWFRIRRLVFHRDDRECVHCGDRYSELHIDHIKPRSRFPELELDLKNLQILCRECNMTKGSLTYDEFLLLNPKFKRKLPVEVKVTMKLRKKRKMEASR